MSARPGVISVSRSSGGAVAVWLIALLIAFVAQFRRSRAEVERSSSGGPATLAFSIDQLHRSNDELEAQIASLKLQQSTLQAGDQRLPTRADKGPTSCACQGPGAGSRPGVVFRSTLPA
jgi:hypothetical protein